MGTPAVFDDVSIEWKGKPYRIAGNRIMPLLARIEEHITLAELAQAGQRRTSPLAKISAAWATVLNYVGVEITPDEVYADLFPNGPQAQAVQAATVGLLSMMIPKSAKEAMLKKVIDEGSDPPARPPRHKRRAAASLSRKHTKRQDSGA